MDNKQAFVLGALCAVFCLLILWPIRTQTAHAQVQGFRQSYTNATLVDMVVTPGPDLLVECFDSNGFFLLPRSIQLVNSTLVEIQFSTPSSGRCIAK